MNKRDSSISNKIKLLWGLCVTVSKLLNIAIGIKKAVKTINIKLNPSMPRVNSPSLDILNIDQVILVPVKLSGKNCVLEKITKRTRIKEVMIHTNIETVKLTFLIRRSYPFLSLFKEAIISDPINGNKIMVINILERYIDY